MKILLALTILLAAAALAGCKSEEKSEPAAPKAEPQFKYLTEQFADLRILRYQVPSFEQLDLQRKTLIYYLYQAALSGRDITWDQNCKHNLCIRRTLENIYRTYQGDRNSENFLKFTVYLKRVWFSNGIHHHYGSNKIMPDFPQEYFAELISGSDQQGFPLGQGETVQTLTARLTPLIFDPKLLAKKINLDPTADLVQTSANNFYEGVTQQEVEDFYSKLIDPNDPRPVSWGLNSKLVKENGEIKEVAWKVGGMYGPALENIVYWLEQALPFTENEHQRLALEKLIQYFRTGELRTFDDYCIEWIKDTDSWVDLIDGFIETYDDALAMRATYESLVQLKDLEATRRVAIIAANAQWFEDNSPLLEQHKKKDVKGISARVIEAVVESGADSPSSPVGINLPNANWIRKEYGSKSVTLGNLVHSVNEANRESGEAGEFILRQADLELYEKFSTVADNLLLDMHEVIGHASGQIEPGVATPRETLKNYSATLEEARADLVALYYLPDTKLVEIGVSPSAEVGKVGYNGFILNGLLKQLKRITPGEQIEEAHMRNRQLVAAWVYEKGMKDKVIEKVIEQGKTYFVINDYLKLRELFGELLREIQRIGSQGDYEAGKTLVEAYGVKVDRALNEEVRERYRRLGIAPYSGYINPLLTPVIENGAITDVKISYPEDFTEQMLYYAKEYSFLPTYN
ncbi:MAG: dihydrofolate reductase [Candidatus Glassbacteria bacterium RIFCSPLOWO2_12_FULL_58_11]|uniref:Dihydrofolate reductase n=1 Tax=Candidatus Glassbacteria bacterium RIFCSPLOWO2_12_FULL_58_11 TaxID=1817867 RepID=A0A1F5YS49_9BACT|nr:MAG: dihydrofolate reductase [Candidatus Glassbacteria bacterium RIFCSPLOWO2_12_FULL_58_11]